MCNSRFVNTDFINSFKLLGHMGRGHRFWSSRPATRMGFAVLAAPHKHLDLIGRIFRTHDLGHERKSYDGRPRRRIDVTIVAPDDNAPQLPGTRYRSAEPGEGPEDDQPPAPDFLPMWTPQH